MSKSDELKKKAEKCWYSWYKNGSIESIPELLCKFAKPREKRISELEQQIEKMKCCGNCQTIRDADGNCYLEKDGKCINLSNWVLRRKGND